MLSLSSTSTNQWTILQLAITVTRMPTLAAVSQVDAADPLRTSATRKYIRHTVNRSIMRPVEHNLHGVCFIDSIYEHFLHCVGSVHSCQ